MRAWFGGTMPRNDAWATATNTQMNERPELGTLKRSESLVRRHRPARAASKGDVYGTRRTSLTSAAIEMLPFPAP